MSSVNALPLNGTGYTANPVFGTGTQIGSGNYVVYDGTGSTVTVTGLSASTSYYYQVFEYNGTANLQGYNTTTTSGNPSTRSSLAAPVATQAYTLAFSAVQNNQLTLSWTNGSGARRVVFGHAVTAVDAVPVDSVSYTANASFGAGAQVGTANFVVFDGTSNTVSVTGLSTNISSIRRIRW